MAELKRGSVVAANQQQDMLDPRRARGPSQGSRMRWSAFGYVIDILQWGPVFRWLVLIGGYIDLPAASLDDALILPGAARRSSGLDYQVHAKLRDSASQASSHFLVTKMSTYPSYTTADV